MLGKNTQTYLVHPQEWKLWIFLFALLVSSRTYKHFQAQNRREYYLDDSRPFEGVMSTLDVKRSVEHAFCRLDVDLVCGPPGRRGLPCDDVYGYPLGAFLGLFPQGFHRPNESSPILANCTLLAQFPGPSLEAIGTTEEREKKTLVRVMTVTFGKLHSRLRKKNSNANESRLLEYYLQKLFCLFGYGADNLNGDTTLQLRTFDNDRRGAIFMSDLSLWTSEEFFHTLRIALNTFEGKLIELFQDLLQIEMTNETGNPEIDDGLHKNLTVPETRYRDRRSKEKDNVVSFLRSLTKAYNNLQGQVFASQNPGDLVCRAAPRDSIKEPYMIFSDTYTNDCMFRQYHSGKSLLTDTCTKAIQAAPVKLEELQLEDRAGFLIISHIFFLGINVASLMLLFMLLTARQRLERRMDHGRRRLEQELNDPFLRDALERKAAKLPDEERRNLVERLEAKISSWDSKHAAIKILRRYTRYFRLSVLYTMVLTTVVYLMLHFFHCSSLPRYLEIMAMSTAMLSASYWAKVGDSSREQPSPTAEIMMEDIPKTENLDLSSTQELPSDMDGRGIQPDVRGDVEN